MLRCALLARCASPIFVVLANTLLHAISDGNYNPIIVARVSAEPVRNAVVTTSSDLAVYTTQCLLRRATGANAICEKVTIATQALLLSQVKSLARIGTRARAISVAV
jgi:hypothetical protein